MGSLPVAPVAGQMAEAFALACDAGTMGVLDYARTLVVCDGDRAGLPLDPLAHPGQACLLQAIEDGATWIALAKPVQDGGTLATLVPVLRRVVHSHQTAVIAYPTLDKAKDDWTNKTWPMIEAQGNLQPEKGGGSKGGAARTVKLRGGGSILLRSGGGGRGESGQAGDTADVLKVEELDDWPDLRAVRRIERRVSRSPDPLLLFVSTVKKDGQGAQASLILRMVEMGCGATLSYPCPHCGVYQRFLWEQVDVEREVMRCLHCPGEISEHQRQAALRLWRRNDARRTSMFSITWTALDSPFPIVVNGRRQPILPGLCAEFIQAQEQVAIGDHGMMRQFVRDRLTLPYSGDVISDEDGITVVPTRNRLAALSSASGYSLDVDRREEDGDSIHLAHLPVWVEHQAVAVDVQRGGDKAPGRLYYVVIGRGGGRGAITGYGSLTACPKGRQPTKEELHVVLDRMTGLMKDWNPLAPIVRRGVDVGDRQDDLRTWLRLHPDWWATKGTDPMKAVDGDHPGWIYRRDQDGGWRLYLIETKSSLRIAHGELMAGSGVGSLAIPKGLDRMSALVRHLCGTVEFQPGKWSIAPKDRVHHPEWQKRIDYAHCTAYARALAFDWERRPKGPRRKYGYQGDLT